MQDYLPAEALRAAETLRHADIVIGIPSYNNANTIAHVVRAAHAGLVKYFPQCTAVIINSDGGSTDSTRNAVLSTRIEDAHVLLLSHPVFPVHRLSVPYHGIPGKGSAFRLIFGMADLLGARACAVVDSDLRSITPEWIDLLLRPLLHADFDFTAPYYHRHKYDGTITNSIVYPLTRALYGLRVRQPIGGEFGVSGRLFRHYLQMTDWETDVARYGIDIWMTTVAICEGFRVCQSFLGAKLHDARDPGTDLSAMLHQVVGSVFELMQRYDSTWRKVSASEDVALFGFRYDVGLDPITIDTGRMINHFRHASADLREIWRLALRPDTMSAVGAVATVPTGHQFHINDELWVRVVYEFAYAYKSSACDRGHLIRSITPLYLAKVASFAIETENSFSLEVEARIERLCQCFEDLKPELARLWFGGEQTAPAGQQESLAEDKAREVQYD